MPPPISYAPDTVGWAVVGVVVLALLIYAAWRLVEHWRSNAYRREALAELDKIGAGLPASLQLLPPLLKRTAIAATSREAVAKLSGHEWLVFLDRTLGGDRFANGSGQLLTRIAYRDDAGIRSIPREDLDQLVELTRRWIEHHDADI